MKKVKLRNSGGLKMKQSIIFYFKNVQFHERVIINIFQKSFDKLQYPPLSAFRQD